MYADDLQIYSQTAFDNLAQAINQTNHDLRRILEWSRCFGIRINPDKTQTIIIGSPAYISKLDISKLPSVECNGVCVPFSESVKNLGIYFDSTLSWRYQVTEVSRKMFAASASLRRLRNFLPTATKISLAQSLLLPILDYADVAYPDLNIDMLNKLERLQNLCIRFVFGLRKFDHVSHYRSQLKWLPIRRRRDLHTLSLLHNILFNPGAPAYLKERFKFISSTHTLTLRSSENLSLMTPSHSTKFYHNSFTVSSIRLWNSLPVVIRSTKSIDSFKRQVKDYLFSI